MRPEINDREQAILLGLAEALSMKIATFAEHQDKYPEAFYAGLLEGMRMSREMVLMLAVPDDGH